MKDMRPKSLQDSVIPP